jgi:hypothetical protein
MRALRPASLTLVVVTLIASSVACGGRGDRKTPEQLRAEIVALEKERDELRAKLGELIASDPRLAGMPEQPVRIGVPTVLAREMISKTVTGFVDQVALELRNIKVKKRGKVKKVVTIGTYDLRVLINEISGKLKTGTPVVRFGGNEIGLDLPVRVASGTGRATITFVWDGKNISGAVCGDMEVTEEVSGSVKPSNYPVEGTLHLTATAEQILASPKFPEVRINIKVAASEASWAEVQKILDSKEGACGFVVDKVNIPKILLALLDKGFNVRLPTEKIKPIAIPVGIQPTMEVKGRMVNLALKVGHLKITEHMIWLGGDVSVAIEPGPAGKTPSGTKAVKPAAEKAAPAQEKPAA